MLCSRMCILLLLLVGLVGCVPQFLGKYTLPRKEPVTDGGPDPVRGLLELTASTNCVEVGEVVTFTVRYKNETADPITIVSDPPIDIVIEALRVETSVELPIQRWSASTQYATDNNPVVQPGEERMYTWQWAADGVYVQQGVVGVMVTAEMQISRRQNPLPQGRTAQVCIGAERFSGGESLAGIPCTSLR